MHGTGADEWEVRGNAAICFLTLGILSGATSLSLFGSARVVWWREQERGVRSMSYFLAATCTQAVGGFGLGVGPEPLHMRNVVLSMQIVSGMQGW